MSLIISAPRTARLPAHASFLGYFCHAIPENKLTKDSVHVQKTESGRHERKDKLTNLDSRTTRPPSLKGRQKKNEDKDGLGAVRTVLSVDEKRAPSPPPSLK